MKNDIWGKPIYVVLKGRLHTHEGLSETKKQYEIKRDCGTMWVQKDKELGGSAGGTAFNTIRSVLDKDEAFRIARAQIAGYKEWTSQHIACIAGLEAAL